MSKRRRTHNAEGTEQKNLPATQQGDSNIMNQEKEDQKMDSKTKRNVLQFIGDGVRTAGDKLAKFNEEHKVLSTAAKVGGAVVLIGGAVAGAVTVVRNGKKDEAVCDVAAEEVDDDYYDEDFDEELDDEELDYDEEDASDSEPEASETSDEA